MRLCGGSGVVVGWWRGGGSGGGGCAENATHLLLARALHLHPVRRRWVGDLQRRGHNEALPGGEKQERLELGVAHFEGVLQRLPDLSVYKVHLGALRVATRVCGVVSGWGS